MKKLFLLIFCITFLYPCFSQKRCEYPACRVDFLKNKLYIVQTGKPQFDSALKVAMAEEWTVSSIGGYISKKELEEMKRSNGNSFLEPAKYNWYIPKSPSEREEHGACVLNFFEGHTVYPSVYINYESIDLLEGYPDEQFDAAIYRLKLIIRGRNNYYKNTDAKSSISKKDGMALLKKKILLINERYIHNADTKDDVYEPGAFDNYHYKVEFAAAAKIEAIIKAKDYEYVLGVRLANDLGSGMFMFDVETGIALGSVDTKGWQGAIRVRDVEMLEKKINE